VLALTLVPLPSSRGLEGLAAEVSSPLAQSPPFAMAWTWPALGVLALAKAVFLLVQAVQAELVELPAMLQVEFPDGIAWT
jgi:hypothetical protein